MNKPVIHAWYSVRLVHLIVGAWQEKCAYQFKRTELYGIRVDADPPR